MGLLTALRKKVVEKPEPEVAVEETHAEALPTGPQLAILVPDVAGISSFRLRLAPSASAAEESISAMRADVRQGTHAFWALHDKPITDESQHVEALVLIRADAGSDLVYVVSFLDIESAHSFTRFEVRRGLRLGNVMIYWAAFATMREELGGVSVRPRVAPSTNATLDLAPPRTTTAVAEPPAPAVSPAPEPVIDTEPPPAPRIEPHAHRTAKPLVREVAPPEPEPVVEESIEWVEPLVETPTIIEEPTVKAEEALPSPAAVDEPFAYQDTEEPGEPMWPTAVAEQAPVIEEVAEPVVEAEPITAAEPVAYEPPAIEYRPFSRDEAAVFAAADDELEVFDEPDGYEEPDLYEEPVEAEERLMASEPLDIAEPVIFQHRLTDNPLVGDGLENGMIVEPVEELIEEIAISDLHTYAGEEEMLDTPSHPHAHLRVVPPANDGLEDIAAIAERLIAGPEIESFPGDEETEVDSRIANRFDPTAGLPETPMIDEFDIAYEVQRFLENRKRTAGSRDSDDGPFSGFRSPPGRF